MAYSIKTPKKEIHRMFGIEMPKKTPEQLAFEQEKAKQKKDKKFMEIIEKDTLTEQELNLIKRRINDKKIKISEVFAKNETFKLTPEQNEKGYKFMYNQYKSPTGAVRKNNPFGTDEEKIIDNFSHFELKDFYSERGNFYLPVYRMYSKDGDYFEYYTDYQGVHIIG